MTFLMISVILVGDTTLFFKCGCAFDFWQQLSWRLNLIVTYNTLCTGAGSDLLIPMLKKYNFILLTIRMVLVRVM